MVSLYTNRRFALVAVFLFEGPVDAGGDLGGTDGAGEVGAVGQGAHEFAPGAGSAVPGFGRVGGAGEGHDAVADEDHGGEVLCAGWAGEEHGR